MFSGFVFRGDKIRPEVIFQKGFVPSETFDHSVTPNQAESINIGLVFNHGVSTTLSTRVAQFQVKHNNDTVRKYNHYLEYLDTFIDGYYFDGYIYLIDARCMAGYGINVPKDYKNQLLLMGKQQAFLHEIYEVKFIHAIPNTSIVGAVWSDDHVADKSCETSRQWMGDLDVKLTLGENPEYDGDVVTVAKLFK